jgi:adenylate kinase family enzyme
MDPERRKIIHLETGARFREFIKGEKFSNKLAAHIAETDGRQPDFLAVWNWARILIDELTGEEHLIFDGTPRAYREALVLDSALTFYHRLRPTVIYLDVSREWSKARLKSRSKKEGRADDQLDALIEQRLNWFDEAIYPAVQYFQENNGYKFLHIKGEQTVEEVARDIAAGLSW